MRSDTKSWLDREREPIRNNAGAVFSRGEAISLVTRIACRKVIKTGWSRSREVAMVISRQGRTYTWTGTNVIGTYITFFENSRVPPCVECGLTHARTTGTCLLLPPRVFRNYSFYLCDRLNARHGIYLGAYVHVCPARNTDTLYFFRYAVQPFR